MREKLTRRQLAAVVAAAPAAFAQTQPAPLPQNPDEELKAARDQNAQNSEQLAKFPLAMATEPASQFKP